MSSSVLYSTGNIPSRIYIIGMMGVGKTTIGKKMASLLHYEFIDLDKEIEAKEGKPVGKIFEEKGEAYFRKFETEMLDSVNGEKLIVATGGGTPCYNNNMELINSKGISVYLEANSGLIFQRISRFTDKRPLLKGMNEEQIKSFISQKLAEREPFYRLANRVFPVPLNTAYSIVKSILSSYS